MAARSEGLPSRAMQELRSKGLNLATSRERETPPPLRHWISLVLILEFSHILAAAKRPVQLDERQVQAVEARIELDLKIGSAFTRSLTLKLKALGGPFDGSVISYGTLSKY